LKIKNIFSSSLLKKGISDSSYYLVANIGSKVLGLLIIPILAKSVTVEEFASYDLFLILSSFLQIFVMLGIDSGIAILMSQSLSDKKKLSFYYVSTLVISTLALLFVSLLFNSAFLFVEELFFLNQEFWFMIEIYILFNIITKHTFNFLRWQGKAKIASLVNLFAYIFGVVLGITFLYMDNSIESYLKGLVIGTFFGAIVSLYISREYIFSFRVLQDAKVLLKELFALSLPFVPNYIGNNLIQMADRVIILMLFGKYELGLYAVIMRLAMIPKFLSTTIVGGFLPVMYNNYESTNGRKLIKNFFHFYILLIPFLFILTYFLSDWAVGLFAGEAYMHIAYLFPMALVSILFLNSTQANGLGYTIARKTHYIIYITFLAIVLNFIFSLFFGYLFGIAGVIFGTLVAGVFRTFFHTKYSEKLHCFEYNFKLIIMVSVVTLLLSSGSYFLK